MLEWRAWQRELAFLELQVIEFVRVEYRAHEIQC